MNRRPPDTAVTALVRHLVDDGARTRRAAVLVAVTVLAVALGACLMAVAVALTGATGFAVSVVGWTAAAIAARRRR